MHDVFISYSHADAVWKDRLTVFLRCVSLRDQVQFRAWNDDEIRIGDAFESTIKQAIDDAAVAVLLVSPDFMASEFVHEVELPWMRERSDAGALAVLPVLIRPSPLSLDDWLPTLQFHPDNRHALSSLSAHDVDVALKELILEIDRLLKNGSPASESASRTWTPLGEAALADYLFENERDTAVRQLRIFKTDRQETWLIATPGRVYCLLDDERTQRDDTLIQWRQEVTNLPLPVGTRPSARYETLGLLDIGDRQNWLYSKNLFADPEDLEARVAELISAASNEIVRRSRSDPAST